MAPSPNRLLALTALLLLSSVGVIQGMRVSPERIAARLRIEREWDDREGTAGGGEPWRGRNRRQLIGGTPKEETIQVTAPLFSSRLFEYGPKVGDKEMGEGLDLAKRLHLSRPLSFFGQSHSSVWVLANGAIGFDNAARVYRPNVLPSSGPKLIAPFWNRNDLRNGGKVFYREVMSGRVLERGQSEIRYQYDRELKVLSAVVVTFEKMQPLGTEPLPEENSNTFQVALFVTTNGTFANFIYSNIGWTQGAEAGFNAGDGANFFALPTSGTGNIMYLEDYGNTGIPGEWMFVLEEDRVVRCKPGIKGDTCDEPCASGEWGADCVRCCHCAEGGCNEASGECKQGGCSSCWRGKNCQQREAKCDAPKQCGQNALQMTDFNRCGEPQHKCECLAGYEGDPNIECTDIDECAQKNTCHEKAVCTNTPGRFFCQCQEGFTGDGIAECVASFLYPFEQSHRLPKDRNGRIEWQLKHPLRVFGRERGHVVITTNGLVLVKGAKNVRVGAASGEQQRLDEMDVQGVAPFFAPIDLAQQGQIFVEETTDPAVLGKGSQLVNEQLGESHSPFVGSHALMITYVNVSLAQTPKLSNTFQTLLIGGRDKLKRENMTFAQFLYRDITWSEGAEAGIMAPDKSNSILLPGSGTVGIEQLAQLSNVRSQGTWLYRIDSASLLPCIQPDLQPPYCDARSPPLVNNNIRAPAPVATTLSTEATTVTVTTTTALATTTTAAVERTTVGGIGESEDGAGEEGTRQRPELPRVEQSGWLPLETPQPAKKQHKSTSGSTRRPAIVTIQSQEIEQMPPDAFDDGTVTRTTVGTTTAEEELLSPRGGLVIEEDAEEQTIVPEVIVPQLVPQRKQQTQRTKPKTELRIEPLPPAPATTTTGQPKKTIVAAEVESAESSSDEEVDLQRTVVPEEPPPTERTTQSSTLPTTTTTTTTTMATTTSALTMGTEETSSRADISRLFVFNTTKPKGTTTRKVVKTTQEPPKMKPENPDGEEPMLMDFDTNQLLESGVQGSKLSIVVPIAIVLIWLVVLLIVAVFLCCRRRQTQQRLRTLYGPAYQIRPVYAMKMDGASYEEHLEKAAQRLSAELAYQPNPFAPGRYSLYGSYWNISPEGSAVRGQNGAKAHQGVQPNGGAHRPTAAMEISSPRGSNDSGGSSGAASVFNNYIQSLGKGAGGGGGTAAGERDGAQQAEYFASSQRSTARFGQNGNGRH